MSHALPGYAAGLRAYWNLNEVAPPYASATAEPAALNLDSGTAPSLPGPGYERLAAYLNWVPASSATRLYSAASALQTDSFGFSFWIRPVNLNPFDSLLTKEMAFDNSVPGFSRMAWQVHALDNNGSGAAPLQLIVRGAYRSQGDFFGSVVSTATLPLFTESDAWVHIAGGYDARTGALRLYVNGSESISGNSSPGADNSDGSPVSLGSARNGSEVITFSAITFMDEVQLYDEPPTLSEVAFLRAHPGRTLHDVWITQAVLDRPSGNHLVSFETTGGSRHTFEASTHLAQFAPVASVTNGIPLVQDPDSAAALPDSGAEGDGRRLNWVAPTSSATRLSASDASLHTDSFGFSFRMRPENLNAFDSLLTKEMPFTDVGPLYSRIAWQVQVLDNNGNGRAALQLIVRGDNRTLGDFYGTVASTTTVPLNASSPYWVHIAGGYDAATGDLRLYVNGSETFSGNSSPGAHHAGGGTISLGSARNGFEFVTFAGASTIDDVQLYASPLTAAQAAFLRDHPGHASPGTPRLLAHWTLNDEDAPFADRAEPARQSTAALTPAALEAALGPGPRDLLFLRVRETPAEF